MIDTHDIVQAHLHVCQAARLKPAESLTDAEKFAIALAAGCRTETRCDADGYRLVIAGRVGFYNGPDGVIVAAQSA